MQSRHLSGIACAAALLLASHSAWAQDAPQDAPQNTQSATPAEGESEAVAELPTVTVTSSSMQTTTGMALTVKETPQSVTVMQQAPLRAQGITTMKDALKTTTGVNVIRDGNRVRYQSRGFYIDQIEEDGLASTVTAGNSGNPYRDPQSMTDLAIYDHIEVVRGATGLTQANSEPGGTINAVRKKPTTARQASFDATADHRGSVRLMGDISGSLNEARTVRGRLVAVGDRTDSFKRTVDSRTGLLYGVADVQAGPSTLLTAGAMYQRLNEVPDTAGIPMAEGGGDAGLPRDTYLGLNWNRSRFTKKNVFAEAEHDINDDWRVSAKLNHIRSDSESRFGAIYNAGTSYAGLPPGGTLPLGNMQRYDNDGRQTAFAANLSGKIHALGRTHDVFATYTWSNEKTNTCWRRVRDTTAFDPFTFRGNEIAQPDWNSDFDDQTFYGQRTRAHALALGTRWSASDTVHLLAGGRYTRWTGSSSTLYDTWNGKPDSDPDEHIKLRRNRFVPYLGATWDITPNTTLYASYTSIFKPQSATDLNGAPLPPVIGKNYEVGVKSAVLDGRLNLTAALFSIEQKNRPISVQDEATSRWYSVPTGLVRSRGLDLEASGHITPAWQLFAGYTFNTSSYRETESNTRLAGMNFSKHTPRHMLRLYTSYRLPGEASRWTLGAGVYAQSKTSSVYDIKQGGWAVVNVNASYDISRNMRLALRVNNLFDRRYYENHRVRISGSNNFYEPPRTVMLTLNWKM